jgi:oligopeptide/dipeptide ABC transporter ATP-binding protein
MVFQGGMNSFNPVRTIGRQIAETIELHHLTKRGRAQRDVEQMLERVSLRPEVAQRYPHELSGGMRQRAMIALALSCKPQVIIADEPTTALDVIVQAQILSLLRSLTDEEGLALIFITHDLAAVAQLCERAAVMYAGRIVEMGLLDDLYRDPRHPYTEALFAATPDIGLRRPGIPLPGVPPRLDIELTGCSFAPRCPKVMDVCRTQPPPLLQVEQGRVAACLLNQPEPAPIKSRHD